MATATSCARARLQTNSSHQSDREQLPSPERSERLVKLGGITLIAAGILAAIVGFILPVRADGQALAQLAGLDQSMRLTGSITEQLNQDALIANPGNPYDTSIPIVREVVAVADVAASNSASEEIGFDVTVVNTRTTTTRADTNEQVSVSAAQYPLDPETSELVTCCGANVNGNLDVQLQGIAPFKFGFDTQAQQYQMFSPVLLAPTPVNFVEDVDQFGMQLMRFRQEIPATQTPAAPLTLPAGLAAGLVGQLAPELANRIPAEGEVDLYEFFSSTTTYLVEPQTGRVVDATTMERATYRLNGGDVDIVTKVAVEASGADAAQIAAQVSEEARPLLFAERAFPWLVGGGLLAVVAGVVLLVIGGRRSTEPALEESKAR